MPASDDLFQLIKSLSKTEKSYFKKFASLFNENESGNYLKLFSEIDKQVSNSKQYSEDKIVKGNYSGKFIKNISYHKNYLHSMIMTSVMFYHRTNKESITLRNLITQSEILIDKLLFEQARKLIQKAKKIAIDRQQLFLLQDILAIEKKIHKNILNSDEFESKNKLVSDEQFKILSDIKSELEYSYLYDDLGNRVKKLSTGYARDKSQIDEIEEIFRNPLLQDENKAVSFQSRTYFNVMHMYYNITKKDYEKAYHYAKKIVGLWEENFSKAGGRIDSYINALNNLLTTQIRTKRFDECVQTALKLKEIEVKFPKYITDKNRVFIFYSVSVLMISCYLEILDPQVLKNHLREVESLIPDYENKITLYQKIILYFFLSVSNLVLSDFEKCIHWTGKIINLEKTDLSEDYQCYARIINLISYYELGYLDSIEYALKSAYHFLSKRKRVYKYENIILKYLRKSFRLKSSGELHQMFEEMEQEIKKIYEDPFEQNAFDAFNILYWLESKLKKKPLINIMKEKKT